MGYQVVDTVNLRDAISDLLEAHGDVIFTATEEGLVAAEQILLENLSAASPKKSGDFHRGWKSSGKKYKLIKVIGNTKTVNSKGRNIPLSNIFEYSTTNHAHPFIGQTFEKSVDAIARAIVEKIQTEV